jgi:hypothetical protein
METRRFDIIPPGKGVLIVPLLASTAAMLGAAIVIVTKEDAPVPWPAYVAFALVPIIALLIATSMFRRHVLLTDAGLRVRTMPWPRTIPVDALDLDQAEIANLESRPELMPRFKIAGTRLPGFRSGLFRLRDKRRASVLLTDLRRVLVLPRRDGTVLLLSLQQPDALLQALRRRG